MYFITECGQGERGSLNLRIFAAVTCVWFQRSSRSRELVFKCGSKAGNSRSSLQGGSREGLNKLARSQSAQKLNPGILDKTQRNKDMKSYLISQVLFDGQENIQASAKEAKPLLQVGSTGF